MILWAWLGWPLAPTATCDAPTGTLDLSHWIIEGERALRLSDRTALDVAEAGAAEVMACMADPLLPADVAAFLRLTGIARFVRRDRDDAARSFTAARATDPTWVLPVELVPDPHPLRDAFLAVEVSSIETMPVPPPDHGWVEVNGRVASAVPIDHPWVLQWRDVDGTVLATATGEGTPAAWPYPVGSSALPESPRRLPSVIASATGQAGVGDLRGGVTLGGSVPVSQRVDVEVGMQGLVAAVDRDAGAELVLLPDLRAGARLWFSSGRAQPFVSAAGLVYGEPERPIGVGGMLGAGLRLGHERFVEIDARAGIRSELVVQASIGLGWWLPGDAD